MGQAKCALSVLTEEVRIEARDVEMWERDK